MAALLLWAPLLLLGTVAGQGQAEVDGCLRLWNATEGNFSVEMTPGTYQANTTYQVTIKDARNHSSSPGQYLLQALSPQNASVGQWKEAPTRNCSSVDTAMLNTSQSTASWTSPTSNLNLTSVQMRVYLSLSDNTTELKTFMLNRGAASTTSPITPPNSVCGARGSSLLPAALLLLSGALLS